MASTTQHCHTCHNPATRFPTRDASETRQQTAFRPLARPGEAPFGASPGPGRTYSVGRYTTAPDALKTAHLKQTLIDFINLPIRHGTKILHTCRPQGQATRHWARRPAQRPARHWGRQTAALDALKTGHWKQTCTDIYVLRTQYERKIKARRVRRGQARRHWARRPAQRPARHWGRYTAAPMH